MTYRDLSTNERLALGLGLLGVGLGLAYGARALRQNRHPERVSGALAKTRDIRVESAVTINRPRAEVYEFWRRIENFPRFMAHLESVQVIDARRSRWRARAPIGMSVQWDAEIVSEREPDFIRWRSIAGSGVRNHGSVRFTDAAAGRGTEVHVELRYHAPAGALGRLVAKAFGEEPGQQVREDLRRFKQLIETGEIAVTDGEGLWWAAKPTVRTARARVRTGVRQ